MDGQLARPSAEFLAASRSYVCVRITDMQAIDIDKYRFDFDLTLAILLANADGTIYHRIGGRTHDDPLAWMSLPQVSRVMRAALATHASYRAAGKVRKQQPARTIYDIDSFRKKIARKPNKPACIHCHTLHAAETVDAQGRGVFRPEHRWIWPDPARVGLVMAPQEQHRIVEVRPQSVAAKAGLRAGDRLLQMAGQRILTVPDIQWVLHNQPFDGGSVPLRYRRGEKDHSARLSLPRGFKVADPLSYSWRSFKWSLRPAPGFGGPMLDAGARRRLGLRRQVWAFRVKYIVDWGDRPQQGRDNRRRGLRIGDLVFSYAGKDDFASMAHFHSWVRLTQRRGTEVQVKLMRKGKLVRLQLRLL